MGFFGNALLKPFLKAVSQGNLKLDDGYCEGWIRALQDRLMPAYLSCGPIVQAELQSGMPILSTDQKALRAKLGFDQK